MRVICSEHPQYLGKHKPTTECICCNTMWEMINRPAEGCHPGGYTTLFGYNDHSSMRIIPEPKKIVKCKLCLEQFHQLKYEKICPECKLVQEIYKEELHEAKMQK
jgi:hypothetical protein